MHLPTKQLSSSKGRRGFIVAAINGRSSSRTGKAQHGKMYGNRNDDAFMALLASQRQFLNRLNTEQQFGTTPVSAVEQRTNVSINGADFNSNSYGDINASINPNTSRQFPFDDQFWDAPEIPLQDAAGSNIVRRDQHPQLGNSNCGASTSASTRMDPISLMNRPIIERRSSLDRLLAQQREIVELRDHSPNVANGDLTPQSSFFMPTSSFPEANQHAPQRQGNDIMEGGLFGATGTSNAKIQEPEWPSKLNSTRRTSIGLQTYMEAYQQSSQQQQHQRPQGAPIYKSRPVQHSVNAVSCPDKLLWPNAVAPQPRTRDPENHRPRRAPTKRMTDAEIEKLKTRLVFFASAMEKSADSQQEIHDWDRTMGLKRSHSKTMRLSARSRKKLRSIAKRELAQLESSVAVVVTRAAALEPYNYFDTTTGENSADIW